MRVDVLKIKDVDPELWAKVHAVRDADPSLDNPMFEPELVRILGEVRDDTRLLVGRDEDGDPIAFMPLHLRAGGWARPSSGPFSDWHGVIGPKNLLEPMLKGAGINGMTVHGVRASDETVQKHRLEETYSHITNLENGFEAFMAGQAERYPNHFKKMRAKFRKIERDYKTLDFTFDDQSDEVFDWVIDLKRAQFNATSRHDVLAPDWAAEFVRKVRALTSPRFRIVTHTVRFGGELAAAEMNMLSDEVLHGWLTVYNRKFKGVSPGLVLVERMIEELVARGITQYDCGPGLTHYKKYYCNIHRPIHSGVIRTGNSLHPTRMLGSSWRGIEGIAPARVSNLMGQTRRRMDQVLLSELTLSGRVSGIAGAMKALRR